MCSLRKALSAHIFLDSVTLDLKVQLNNEPEIVNLTWADSASIPGITLELVCVTRFAFALEGTEQVVTYREFGAVIKVFVSTFVQVWNKNT